MTSKDSMSDNRVDVLIVGAGPTGLALAGILARGGLRFRIIDRNLGPSDQSKALGVQAGTLEAMEDVFGADFVKEMVDEGQPARCACIHINNRPPLTIDLSRIPSCYNFILMLEQSKTERFLEEQLQKNSHRVERQTELLSVIDGDNGVTSKVRSAHGVETIQAKYLVGCDGAHSPVRHLLNIPFSGAAYQGDFVLGDVKVEWPWDDKMVRTFISAQGAIACFPMKGDRRYRLILIPKRPDQHNEAAISLDEFVEITRLLSKNQIHVSDPIWLTRFRVHHRMVRAFRKGNCFLAGDAAHIHSPAGGQGMNTGIQDAFNLGAKLIRVLGDGADPRLLDRYERERRPVARKVLRGTDLFFRLAILPENPLIPALRGILLPKIINNSFIQRKVVAAISEVAIARREHAERVAVLQGRGD